MMRKTQVFFLIINSWLICLPSLKIYPDVNYPKLSIKVSDKPKNKIVVMLYYQIILYWSEAIAASIAELPELPG